MGKIALSIAKPTKVILWVGFALALIVAFLIGYIASNHNPQGVFSEGDGYLQLMMLSWFIPVFLFFSLIALLVEGVVRFRRKRDAAPSTQKPWKK